MKNDKELLKRMNQDIDYLNTILELGGEKIGCFIATEETGILPHQIAEGSLILFDREEKYNKGDFIIISDIRNGKKTHRITKAWSEKEERFFGRILFTVKRFNYE